MTKKNLIIVIVLLTVIDLVAAGWYMSRRIETGDNGDNLFGRHDTTEVITEADTVVNTSEPDVFDDLEFSSCYHVANSPSVSGDKSTCYTSIKHVKVRWPLKVNGEEAMEKLNKELIRKAFDNSQQLMKDARFVYLRTPSFNKPMGDDHHTVTKMPAIVPIYGNVSQVLVYPYMTSNGLLVMEIDKVEYNGHATIEDDYFIHYDRVRHRILTRIDILSSDISNENKLLKLINKKIDSMNRGRSDSNRLQHALNVPAELCCSKDGIIFQFRQGSISSGPVGVEVDYDDLKPYLTKGFAQLLESNDGYQVFKENIKPEPVNVSRQPSTAANLSAPIPEKHEGTASASYSHNSSPKKSTSKGYHKKNRYYSHAGNGYNSNGSSTQSSYYQSRTSSGGDSSQQSVKRGYRSQKSYSGAKRKSGRYGYSGKRHWSHRRR